MSALIAALFGLLAGAAVGALAFFVSMRLSGKSAGAIAERLIAEAERERERLLREAELRGKEMLLELRAEEERDSKRRRDEQVAAERSLRQREVALERERAILDERQQELRERHSALEADEAKARAERREADDLLARAKSELERVASLSAEEAKRQLLASVEERARKEAAQRVAAIEEQARRQATERATAIVASAAQRLAGQFVSEKTVAVVELPSDDMKGRIIGREGRNIRAIEAATGVDVIIDDTPEVVVVSAWNPIRREIGRLSLERLVADGRIHPARIEEVVDEVTGEMEEQVQKHGEQAVFDLGLHGVHPELVKLVGRLKFHVSGGQNLWNHSVETALICGMMAAELGVGLHAGRRAGLLHDIGRVAPHGTEGPHAHIAAEVARRLGEKPEVVAALREHHDDAPSTVLGALLQAADALSKARPGARREQVESYVKRLEALESIPRSFRGVSRAYALQAGREVRVIVDFESVSDQEALLLSGDIARRIEQELTYPGEVKVTVVREARATEIAR